MLDLCCGVGPIALPATRKCKAGSPQFRSPRHDTYSTTPFPESRELHVPAPHSTTMLDACLSDPAFAYAVGYPLKRADVYLLPLALVVKK